MGSLPDADANRAKELREVLDRTIEELFQINHRLDVADGEDQDVPFHTTDYLIVVGYQCFIDSDSGTPLRGGDVKLISRDGSMPMYVARGLLASAAEFIERRAWSGQNEEG